MQKGISQKAKTGANSVEQTMLATAGQPMKTSESFMSTFHHILV